MNNTSLIEAVLFFYGEPVGLKKLAKMANLSEEDTKIALNDLKTALVGRGITLLENGEDFELRTAPEASKIIEELTKENLMRDLGKAGLETLSIILYKGPVKRGDIDFIRGVSSSFILRNLLVRGLVERVVEKGERGFLYTPSMKLLAHLGISSKSELPEFQTIENEFNAFEENIENTDSAPVEELKL